MTGLGLAASWSQTGTENFFWTFLTVFYRFRSYSVTLVTSLEPPFPPVPRASVVIHVVKNASRSKERETSVYKGYKRDKIEMRGDRAEISDFPLYLNTVAGGLDCRDQTIGGFSFVVKIYAVPVVEIIG